MTEEKMRMKLLFHIKKKYGTQTEAAKQWGVQKSHVSNMITGRKRITDEVLAEMGYQKDVKWLVTYSKIKNPA